MELFGDWCDTVTDLIRATPEDDVLRRDIFDRAPVFQWVDGRVVLLGDAAHAMQPNLGQGGCMAIEDAFVLAEELEVARQASGAERPAERKLTEALKRYRERRMMRAAAIHGMARMAAYMASTYKTHLGEGMGPLQALTRLRIPHPGRMAGRIAMILSMPSVLAWVLGGFNGSVSHSRASACRLGDSPACLPLDREGFAALMGDDLRLLAAANCDWLLVPGSHAAHGSDTEFRPLSGKVVGTTGVLGRLQDAYQGPVDLFVINGRVSASGTGVPAATVERGAQGLFELKGGRRGVVVRSHVTGTTRIREGASIVLHPGDEVAAAEESTHDECLVMKTRHLTLRPKPASRSDRGTTVAGSYAYAARGDGMPGL